MQPKTSDNDFSRRKNTYIIMLTRYELCVRFLGLVISNFYVFSMIYAHSTQIIHVTSKGVTIDLETRRGFDQSLPLYVNLGELMPT